MKAKYLVILVFLLIVGCKKEIEGLTFDLQGTWELTSTTDWIGHVEYEPGNGNTINFSGNTYSQTIKTTDTTYQYSGTFRIYIDKPCDYAREQTLIKFDDNDASSFFLLDGKLTVGQRNVWQMAGAQPMKRSGNIATAAMNETFHSI